MRQIVLDTETTGLDPQQGHRIIEIGAVEMINRKLTGNNFHVYLNPQREIDAGAVNVHGLTNKFLQDKPLMGDVADKFLTYIADDELIIHNAKFDIGFINAELSRLQKKMTDNLRVIDTLLMARERHPGQKNNLDALCKRYNIDNSKRDLHGALLDANLLALLYLAMTGGQGSLFDEENNESDSLSKITKAQKKSAVKIIRASEAELQLHAERLQEIEKISKNCLWLKET
ncbi:MAG TPA: DNA polymerase III subunit epsilon [Gammaproteobacteria bacterium]|nr:DNA polymerase III subunit epsilon [Gammaproteobacteria bacterium]